MAKPETATFCKHCGSRIVFAQASQDAPMRWWHDKGPDASPRFFQYCDDKHTNEAEPRHP